MISKACGRGLCGESQVQIGLGFRFCSGSETETSKSVMTWSQTFGREPNGLVCPDNSTMQSLVSVVLTCIHTCP